MRLVSPTRRAALVAAAVTAAAGAAIGFSPLGDSPAAAGTPPSPSPSPSASASASGDPIVTPLAAALVPSPIDIDRRHPSNVVSVRIDFRAGDTTGWHSHPGPVLVQVVSGAVTLRHAAHGRCLSQVVRAGHGFFEAPGAVHVAENPRPAPAVLYATFVLPPKAGPEVSAPIPAPCR
jgi:quercetin dioxygenase-like cupin family protein